MEKKDKKNIVIIILIIVIIILLVLRSCSNDTTKKNESTPTGNVDIFNIECTKNDTNCTCTSNSNTNNDDTDNKDKDDSLIQVGLNKPDQTSNEQTNEEVDREDGLVVTDKNIKWNSTNKLRIFSNPSFENEGIIAPGSSNSYKFIINNNQQFDVVYNLTIIETNKYNVNMKYRLKKNGNYILGDKDNWVYIREQKLDSYTLSARKKDNYELEWKWFDSENDTDIAILDEANYQLNINIAATSK